MTSETRLFPLPGGKESLEAGEVLTPRFSADGTIACVTVDADSGQVLMVAYMNAESLALTIETGEGWYWSRSRGELWHKGATSGNVQRVVELLTDCDQDALVLRVRVDGAGATCHTGQVSCFYRSVPLGQKAANGQVRLEHIGGERRFDPDEVYGHKH